MKIKSEDIKNDKALMDLKETARDQGLCAYFLDYMPYEPEHMDSGLYFVVSPTPEEILDLQAHPEDFANILEHKKKIGRHSINPYYEFVRMDDYYKDNNYFKTYMECLRAIEDVCITKNAFFEFGYTLPTEFPKETVLCLYDMDQRRRSTKIPDAVRKRYERSYEKYVSDVNQRYKKLELSREKHTAYAKQTVSQDYFNKNRITAVHDAMNDKFREYFETRVKDFPEFHYYLENKPYLSLKDISHSFKGAENSIFKDDVELKEYNVMFPKYQEDIYYKILLEYNCRNYAGQSKSIYELGNPHDFRVMTVNMDDMWNWNSLCTANNVKYYINHGELDHLCALGTREIKIAYNVKDEDMVCGIVSRLADSRKNARFVSRDQMNKSVHNQPKDYVNPFCKKQLDRSRERMDISH